MFTWNLQYISRARLAETISQLMLGTQRGDILVRIHTSIHKENEAVELAGFIKELIPNARIFGTSASATIMKGRLSQNQCVISITQMQTGTIRSAMIPVFDEETGRICDSDQVCEKMKSVIGEDSKFALVFLTQKYSNVADLIETSNSYFPGVQMAGGLANLPHSNQGFVFDETGSSISSLMIASIGGDEFECMTSVATGVEMIGNEVLITDAFGPALLEVDSKNAMNSYSNSWNNKLDQNSKFKNLFPYVYADDPEIPVFIALERNKSLEELYPKDDPSYAKAYELHPDLDTSEKHDYICANHNIKVGKIAKRAFIYDRKIISDNRELYQRVESFEKAETIFGYTCILRSMIYNNCAKWELSAYENTNISGCVTFGEIAFVNGRNVYANCSFVVSVMGEAPATPEFNPFAFSRADSLVEDNMELLNFLMDIENKLESMNLMEEARNVSNFVRDCEFKLMYSDSEDIPNEAAMKMDIKINGYNRICFIDVSNVSSMKSVFPEKRIQLTYKSFIDKCMSYANRKHYRFYSIENWQVAIGAQSHMASLKAFVSDMETLQHQLFETKEETIAIVPAFCLLDDCNIDNIGPVYTLAKIEMAQKNVQFYVRDTEDDKPDDESIREHYHMVNVINYAIAHNGVIPYFQGIYDNNEKSIHHYESLMRLKDENGKIYYPGSFLEVARTFGLLYDSLSFTMIQSVFEKFKDIEDKSVSINLSFRDIKNKKLVEYIYDFLRRVKHPENFVFEILENEELDDYDLLIKFVDNIHDLGGKISIDDFGSGYSNLQHVASIHSDFLKIDGSIVRNCCNNQEAENLIALIAAWRQISSRNVKIIAEFVENEDIQNKLLHYAIDYSQGYLFSKPAPEMMEDKKDDN